MSKLIKKLISILNKKQKIQIIILVFLMLIGALLESIGVSLILPLVSVVLDETSYNSKWYSQVICSIFHIKTSREYLCCLLLLLLFVFVFKNIYLLIEYYLQYTFIARCRYSMQKSLMHQYLYKPYSFYLNVNSGEIIRVITGDTGQTFLLLSNVMQLATEAFVGIVLSITILLMSPTVAVCLVVILMVELFIINRLVKPVMKRNGDKQREENAIANKWMLQGINGIKSIKVTGNESFFEDMYCSPTYKVLDIDRINQTLGKMPTLIIETFTIVGILMLIFIMVVSGSDMTIILPQLSAFAVAAVRLLPSVNRMSASLNQIPFLEGGLDNVINVIRDQKVEGSLKTPSALGNSCMEYKDNFSLQGISFAYDNASGKIVDNLNLCIEFGQSIGVIGKSGAGKTTVMDIMLGLLEPCEGEVLVDGVNIKSNMQSFYKSVSYIPQQIFLLDDTIRANVAFGVNKEKIDDDAIWRAIADSQLEEFVKSLPDGLDTIVGEFGIRLSGGQRQRIGIARALYTNPRVLFLDEATSALDSETESAIMEAVNKLKRKVTMIIIAHRLSTISSCDMVYRVEDGRLIRER